MAWICIGLGAMNIASGLLQALLLLISSPAVTVQRLSESAGLNLPPLLTWAINHLGLLNFLSILLSALFTWISYGLLKRFEWARLSFIALLILSAIGFFIGADLFLRALAWVNVSYTAGVVEMDDPMNQMQQVMRYTLYTSAVMIAALHGWIAYLLCRPTIRAEFKRHY
ncbi:MAG: hypothetical protein LBV45_06155 [Xanthomonadaceae bacterium]|nr:hypothetical protein [Xanthomonadaceae bacterium]